MPPKLCGRCNKTVYPTEELKCLDKVWHKGCFKCQTCNMTLNMKNYKGYDKLPYCNAHYPQTKHTAVADTPESRRIAENTKIQSNIKYHAEYEKQKGKKITVADDPETQRVRHNMEVISNIAYHGDRERRSQMEMARPAEQVEAGRIRGGQPGRIADYDPAEQQQQYGGGGTPYSNRNSAGARQVYDSNVGRAHPVQQPAYDPQPPQQPYQPPPQQYQPPPPSQPQQPMVDKLSGKGMVCKAMYDYDAADNDEVSFRDGDLVIFCQPIDDGWMEGTVEKTGQRGMLPSNYVEVVKK
ncbi:LIM and SH3 domain protein 1 [Mactra antiquata]